MRWIAGAVIHGFGRSGLQNACHESQIAKMAITTDSAVATGSDVETEEKDVAVLNGIVFSF